MTVGLVDVTMPQMGVSVAEGTVVEWKKGVGDQVERDEIICAISTDKIDTDVESPATGVVQEILVDVDKTVAVGVVMARISTGGEMQPSPVEPSSAAPAHSAPAATRRYSPVVNRMAAEHGLNLEAIVGTGREGRVRKQDVLAVIESNGKTASEDPPLHIESPYKPEPAQPDRERHEAPAPAVSTTQPQADGPKVRESVSLSRMRKSIGQHMVQSLQTAATCTTIVEVDLSRIETARKKFGLSYLPFIARATIDTLREFPQLNAHLQGETFTTYEDVNLGIAVSLGDKGLLVPVIPQAQNYSVEGLASQIKEIAGRARAGQLTPDDLYGATFTITNPGRSGSIIATPIINQPQVAILDTEAVVKRAVVITDSEGNDSIAIRPMTYLCLSWDHRALDGAAAAQFLSGLRKRLEAWVTA